MVRLPRACYRMAVMADPRSHRNAANFKVRSRRSLRERAWEVLQREGLGALVVAVFRRCIFDHRSYLLYQYDLWNDACTRPRSKPEGFDGCFVVDNATADELSESHADFRHKMPRARRALDCGAVAFCLYQGKAVAHIGWLATSPASREALDSLGFEIRFDRGEAWTGAIFTVPRFRNRGLSSYSQHVRFAYLRDAGFNSSRAAIETTNAASNHVQKGFQPRAYATGHMFVFLGLRRWRERTLAVDQKHCQ